MLLRVSLVILLVSVMIVGLVGTALADNPGTQGQPNQTCGSDNAKTTPGPSVSAPGSAFNPDGMAGTVYAGEQQQNSKNPISVSQYDVACFQVSQSHH